MLGILERFAVLALTVLLLPACASAQASAKETPMAYTEKGLFYGENPGPTSNCPASM